MNPNIGRLADRRPARVTICVLVCIPNLSGYYAHRVEVLRLCLSSLFATLDPTCCDVLLFDNGSCPEVAALLRGLHDQGRVEYLFRSRHNIGKANAYRQMFAAAPGDVIAYADDDVLFHPGWLASQLAVLDAFPRVGMVSGVPVNLQFVYGNRYLPAYLSEFPDIVVRRGHFIPDEWRREFDRSTGRGDDETSRLEEVLLTRGGVSAYATASHFQFIARRDVILQALPAQFEPSLMRAPVRAVDERLDELGFARLSTSTRFVQHIGNVVSPDLREAIDALGLAGEVRVWAPPGRVQRALAALVGVGVSLRNWFYFVTRYRTQQQRDTQRQPRS